jgi:hypothetical protein
MEFFKKVSQYRKDNPGRFPVLSAASLGFAGFAAYLYYLGAQNNDVCQFIGGSLSAFLAILILAMLIAAIHCQDPIQNPDLPSTTYVGA